MAGIESFYSPQKKSKTSQIPVDEVGKADARAAPDTDIDEYVKTKIIERINKEKQNQESTQATGQHSAGSQATEEQQLIITSSYVTTNIFHVRDLSPKEAIRQIIQWEQEGVASDYAMETNIDHLTKQVVGIPKPPPDMKSTLTQADKFIVPTTKTKIVSDEELNSITKGLNNIIKGEPIDDDGES